MKHQVFKNLQQYHPRPGSIAVSVSLVYFV